MNKKTLIALDRLLRHGAFVVQRRKRALDQCSDDNTEFRRRLFRLHEYEFKITQEVERLENRLAAQRRHAERVERRRTRDRYKNEPIFRRHSS